MSCLRHGPFKVRMRVVTESELLSLEQGIGEKLEEEARRLREMGRGPLY